jgi:hypothetical protein
MASELLKLSAGLSEFGGTGQRTILSGVDSIFRTNKTSKFPIWEEGN